MMPEGYGFYERPDTAQVLVPQIKPSPITEAERQQAEEIVRRVSGLEHFVVDVEENAIVVYTPSASRADADNLLKLIAGPLPVVSRARYENFREHHIKHSPYMKMLRFALVNPDTRQYSAERWCFRGSIDDWIMLRGFGPLAELVENLARHLAQESFFEIM